MSNANAEVIYLYDSYGSTGLKVRMTEWWSSAPGEGITFHKLETTIYSPSLSVLFFSREFLDEFQVTWAAILFAHVRTYNSLKWLMVNGYPSQKEAAYKEVEVIEALINQARSIPDYNSQRQD
jgi:hypothetical protein